APWSVLGPSYVTSGASEAHARSRRLPCGAAQRSHEDRILPGCVRREERHDLSIVEGEPGRAEALGVRAQIEPPSDDAGFEIRDAITTIAHVLERMVEICEEEHGHGRGAAERLLETEERGVTPKVAEPDGLERVSARMVRVGPGRDSVHRVDREVEIHDAGRRVHRDAARRVI